MWQQSRAADIRRFHVVDHDRSPLEAEETFSGREGRAGRAERRREAGEKALEV